MVELPGRAGTQPANFKQPWGANQDAAQTFICPLSRLFIEANDNCLLNT